MVDQNSQSAGPAPATGWRKLSQLVLRRTTDLLAIAIVAVTILMVGGRLGEWWSTKPEEIVGSDQIVAVEAGTVGQWGAGGTPVTVALGGSRRSLRRETIHATEDELNRRLVAWCRRMVEESELPTDPPDETETRLTRRLRTLTPEADAARRGKIYRIVRPTRLILGTRTPGTADTASPSDSDDAARSERLVCWGIAFPQGPRTWALFLSGSSAAAARSQTLPEVKLPAGCEQLLTVQNDAGDGLTTFFGAVSLVEASRGIDDWFTTNGWTNIRPGRSANGRWTARYGTPKTTEPRVGWIGAVDVQIQEEPDRRVSGMLNYLPPPTPRDSP